MELWTDYEGKTIDGAFPLKKLLAPEGRSAFFSTANGNGDPALIRLIESHFDADEILARWHGVQALGHPNLLRLEQYSQVAMDGTTVIYAVMEPVDANLASVVSEQRLTVQETMQLASSVASALDVLHTHGFVHEHVEPANIFAVGDVVKLRSDCIREAPEGAEGVDAKKRDIHDLALVLLQALTQQRTLADAAHELPLASPFDAIVRKSMSGEWGVAEIQTALQTPKRPSAPAAVPAASRPRIVEDQAVQPAARATFYSETPKPESATADAPAPWAAFRSREDDGTDKPPFRTGSMIAVGFVVLLGLWLGWHFAHNGSSDSKPAPQANAKSSSTTAPPAQSIAPAVATKPSAGGSGLAPAQNNTATTETHAPWRVVAFTYNHREQAQAKSATVAQQHPELRPDVFSPNGRAPYLVTVGGAMNREDAMAFAQRARKLGLPRDTYAQNYSVKAH